MAHNPPPLGRHHWTTNSWPHCHSVDASLHNFWRLSLLYIFCFPLTSFTFPPLYCFFRSRSSFTSSSSLPPFFLPHFSLLLTDFIGLLSPIFSRRHAKSLGPRRLHCCDIDIWLEKARLTERLMYIKWGWKRSAKASLDKGSRLAVYQKQFNFDVN